MATDFVIVPMYYGRNFDASSSSSNFKAPEMDAAIVTLCSTDYFRDLHWYGVGTVSAQVGAYVSPNEIPDSWAVGKTGFREADIVDFVKDELANGRVPARASFGSSVPIYVVILKQGQISIDFGDGAAGAHQGPIVDGSKLLAAWVYQGIDRPGTTPILAHEVVEVMTSEGGAGERSDHCESIDKPIGGVMAEAYLAPLGRCVIPGVHSEPAGTPVCMAWKGTTDDGLYFTTFYKSETDGEKWDYPLQAPGVFTSHAPALAVEEKGGVLILAWKGPGNDQQLYWSSWNGHRWTRQQPIPGAHSSSHPALASYAGRLYCVYRGGDNDTKIFHSSFDLLGGWRTPGTSGMPNGPRTSDGVALFAGRELHMVWKEADGVGLWAATLDIATDSWVSLNPLKARSSHSPSIAGLSGAAPHTDPKNPSPSGNVGGSVGVLPSAQADRFLLTWKGATDTRIFQARFENNNWSSPVLIPGVATLDSPAIAGDGHGRLWRVWRGAGEPDIWWSTSANAGDTWSPQQTVAAGIALDTAMVPATSHHPALVVFPRSASQDS